MAAQRAFSGGTGGGVNRSGARTVVIAEVGETFGKLRSIRRTGCPGVEVAALKVVNVNVNGGSTLSPRSEIGVPVSVLPFHVVVVQGGTNNGQQQGIQCHDYQGSNQLAHVAIICRLRCGKDPSAHNLTRPGFCPFVGAPLPLSGRRSRSRRPQRPPQSRPPGSG